LSVSATTVQRVKGVLANKGYVNYAAFEKSLECNPDVVVVQFGALSTENIQSSLYYDDFNSHFHFVVGTNDAKQLFWNETSFIISYLNLIHVYEGKHALCWNITCSVLYVV